MRGALVAVLVLFAARSAQAAPFAGVDYDMAPSSKTELMSDPDAAFRVSNLALKGLYPIKVAGGRVYLLPGLRYRLTLIDQTAGDLDGLPDAVHDIGLNLGGVVLVGKSWSVLALAIPVLATDFSRVGAGSLRLTGTVVARRRHGPKRMWGVGAVATYAFGDFLPLPAVVIDWHFNDRFRIDAFLPSYFDAAVAAVPGVEVGVRAQVAGNRFSIDLDAVPDAENLRYSAVDAGLRAGYQLNKFLWLTGYAGYLLYRRVDVFDGDGNEVASVDPDRQVIFRFGIEARPP